MKKQWKKPELLVLVRTRPEEAVLSSCKDGKAGSDVVASDAGCLVYDGAICGSACASPTAS